MYQEVAFDPLCLSEFHYYGLLKSQFGFEKGRYVVAPVKAWVREAQKAVKSSTNMQPIKKASIKNYLNKLQKLKHAGPVTLPNYRIQSGADEWLEWCEKEFEREPFSSIISERITRGFSYDDLIENPDVWNISPTVQIRKTSTDIVGVLEPLIKLGGSLTLIDPYFRLSGNAVLEGIIESSINKPSISSITLVTTIDTINPVKLFAEQYLTRYPNCPSFSVVVVPEKYFHDRYLISKFGAIKAGHGFSEAPELGAHADFLSISLCSVEEANNTMSQLSKVIKEGKALKMNLHEA